MQTSGARSTPDVAFDADPSSGVLVYSTAPGARSGSWQVVGGTSLGSPAWAAIIAIADQGRAVAGLGSLDGATQTLPALYAAAASSAARATSTPWRRLRHTADSRSADSTRLAVPRAQARSGAVSREDSASSHRAPRRRRHRQHSDRSRHAQGGRAHPPSWPRARSRRRFPASASAPPLSEPRPQ